jgi:uncharacterized protein YeaO (DUF488 family)
LEIRIAGVQDPAGAGSEVRVLVDRVSPRGVAREAAPWQHWHPEVAPSRDLSTWWNLDPGKFALFEKQYLTELAAPKGAAAVARLRAAAAGADLVLVTASAGAECNHAQVLRRLLLGEARAPR